MSAPEKLRILVVEDERHIARFLQYVLEKAGFQVMVALDGKTALGSIGAFRPDGVVLDLILTDFTSCFVRLLKADFSAGSAFGAQWNGAG